MTPEQQFKEDMKTLLATPAFTRTFLWRVIQLAGIFSATTDGSEGRDFAIAAQARKNLGLDILSMVEAGQPVSHPEGLPVLTVLQTLREEANRQPQEKPSGRRNDRYSDLDDRDSDDD